LIPDATFRSHAGENRHAHVNIQVADNPEVATAYLGM
jgi:hypothetical protein